MQRIFLFLLTNIAIMVILSITLRILGVARQDITREQFQQKIIDALNLYVPGEYLDDDVCNKLIERINYCCCDLKNHDDYRKLEQSLNDWSKPISYYLAIPPDLFEAVCDGLYNIQILTNNSRIVVEKPIGYSLESSRDIHDKLLKHFNESQIYRIDHYLGKETVQNLIALRFANSLFSSQWNSKSIEYIEITAAESVGIEGRWDYFDGVGQMRDMVQSHILQLLCLITMEPPSRLNDESIRNEKVKVLQALKPIEGVDIHENVVRGQYEQGVSEGDMVARYKDEPRVSNESTTDTFIALKAEIDNWRWSGVPFYLRTGKRLAQRACEIVVQFKEVPHSIFEMQHKQTMANKLVFRLQPDEGVRLQLCEKRIGHHQQVRPMTLSLKNSGEDVTRIPDAYERLLADVINNNATLFLREDELMAAWKWADPILQHWQNNDLKPETYAAGSWGPAAATLLLAKDGRLWEENN